MTFPTNPTNNQLYTRFGRQYIYDSAKGVWRNHNVEPILNTANIDNLTDVDTTTAAPTDGQALVWDNANSVWKPGTVATGGGSGLATYESISNLPVSATIGDLAYVIDNKKMYLWNGTVWFHILTAETPNTAPFITTQPKFGYSLATDGTPLVLTLNAIDPEGTAITWSYAVTDGTLGNTATISISNNQITITPSTNTADAGEFELTFTASDGLHVANSNPAYFSLYFTYDWIYGTMTVEDTIESPAFSSIVSGATSSTLAFGSSLKFMKPNELLISSPGTGTTASGAIWIYDTSVNPAVCIAHYVKLSGVNTSGAKFGLTVDFNDEWIVASTDENGSNGNAQILWFKRNTDGTWPTDTNGRLTVYQETTGVSPSLFGGDNLSVAVDKNNNRCIIANGNENDIYIYEYDEITTQWIEKHSSIGTSGYTVSSAMLDNYAVTVGYNNDPLVLYKRNINDDTWSVVNSYYLYSDRAKVKLLSYNGDYIIVLFGGSQGTSTSNTLSYSVQVLALNSQTDNISEIMHRYETLTATAAGASAYESTYIGNPVNEDYADAYISGDILHVIVNRPFVTNPDTRYFQVDLSTNTYSKNTKPEATTLTGAGGASILHSAAFDKYTGKLALSQSTYNTGVAGAGKVWILR